MNSGTAYTDLETLLLFQALRVDGVTATTFNRISDQLKSVSLIRNDPKFDSGRLSPDALRELYLGLLKEEVKQDDDRPANGETLLTNGNASPGSRKRKAPSPSLPTVRDAAQHSHLIPKLVSRLYARYREGVVYKLHTYEKKYAKAKQDIAEIEAGQRDDFLQRQRAASQAQASRLSPKPSTTAHTQPSLQRKDHVQPEVSAIASSMSPQRAADTAVPAATKPFVQAKIDAVINHGPELQESPGGHRGASSNTSLPPLSEMAPGSPPFGIPPKIPAPVLQHVQQISSSHSQGYTSSPPAGRQLAYVPQHSHPRPGSVQSPQLQQTLSRPSSSPRPILPPPTGVALPPPPNGPHAGSPVPHVPQIPPQYPQPYGIQHRMPSGPPQTPEGSARGYPPPMPPQPVGYYQQLLPHTDRRPSHPAQPTQQGSPYPQPQHPGGYMLPPFQVQSQDLSRPMPQPQNWSVQTPGVQQRPSPYTPQMHHTPATFPRNARQHTQQEMSHVLNALSSAPRSRPKPLWKSEYPSNIPPATKPRPEIEPLSPTLERVKSPVRQTRNKRGQNVPTVEGPAQTQSAPRARTSKRRTNARDRSPHSVVSSTADESLRARTRSHSVSTAAGAHPPSADSRPSSRNGVEAELSTPANTLDEPDSKPAPSGTPAAGMMTRKRRGTVQSLPRTLSKRKRQDSPDGPVEEPERFLTPPARPTTVTATRNFAKMSSAIMNDIASHKHGSYFAKEVRDKDAPGYSEIVRLPQNLKSIRSAITAGGRAIAAASSNLDSPSATTSTSSTTVELERSADLLPPKAIVNGAQLEKELMRMFANAYLFNPGEDGMALTTKEMFEDVEQKIRDWRGAEREAGRDAHHVDDDESGKSKRRKL